MSYYFIVNSVIFILGGRNMNQEKMGKFIAECRKKKKMTQEELAERLNVNIRTVSRWETGVCIPDLSLYESLCNTLGITINELLSGTYLSKEDYLKTFEKNIINVVDETGKKKKVKGIIKNSLIVILSIYVIFLILLVLANGVTFKQDFKDNNISIEKTSSSPIRFNVDSVSSGQVKYAYLTKDDYTIIFITRYQTIMDKLSGEKYNSITGYDLNNKQFGEGIEINGFNLKDKIKVYYTSVNFKKIATADNDVLADIINDSKLLYTD